LRDGLFDPGERAHGAKRGALLAGNLTRRADADNPPVPQSFPHAFRLEPLTDVWHWFEVMTAQEILQTVATMPCEDWMKIQSGIAEMVSARFSEGETAAIHDALAEAESGLARGEGYSSEDMRRHFGLQ